jgi:hypothetical protein
VNQSLIVQGRRLDGPELEKLRQWVGEHPDWSRRRLSLELATRWDWRNGAGQLKDMAARTLLVKLDQRGLVPLPARRQSPTNRMRCCRRELGLGEVELAPLACALSELGTLQVTEVSPRAAERAWIRTALGQFHYLGFGGAVGQNLQYVVGDSQGRRLACLVFGAAAWQCQNRDRFIGWSAEQRHRNLGLIANNTRFLVLPSVQVPGLGSWILGQVRRRIAGDWQAKYGQGIVLLETFVERPRFAGTVYRAAHWQRVGVTAGRTRQDRHTSLQVPSKDIYLSPLSGNFREALQA